MFLKKSKIELPYDSFLGISKGKKIIILKRYIYFFMLILALVTTGKVWK